MPTVTLARQAMATRFELVLAGEDPVALRAAGEEALDEIDRLESQWSLYRPESELARLNARASREPVQVTPELFTFLEHARRLHGETEGAFDLTIAPLVRCWGFLGGSGQLPEAAQIAAARVRVGMGLVNLDPVNSTVSFVRAGVMLDPGAIGKGYAVGRAAEILREAGVEAALIHGGTSTVYAFGQAPGATAWKVAIDRPPAQSGSAESPLAVIELKDEALSVSAVWGKHFDAGGKRFGHVLDPRTGQPVQGAVLAAVVVASATESDALSTALLVLGPAGLDRMAGLRPGLKALLVTDARDGFKVETRGIPLTGCDLHGGAATGS
jgi:thiamine biosynthesis lipoprotein